MEISMTFLHSCILMFCCLHCPRNNNHNCILVHVFQVYFLFYMSENNLNKKSVRHDEMLF